MDTDKTATKRNFATGLIYSLLLLWIVSFSVFSCVRFLALWLQAPDGLS